MKKIWMISLIGLSLLLGIFFMKPDQVKAADTNNVGFTVQPELPDNQINKDIPFYYLKVDPGSSQDLTFKIINKDSKQHRYLVELNRGTTNSNGILDFSQHGLKKDASLTNDIETMFPAPQKITVAPNSTKEVSLHMTTPAGSFKGMLLGGIRIVQLLPEQKEPQQKPTGAKLAIQNRYSYVIAVQIQQNTDAVKPNLKLQKAYAVQDNGKTSIAANLENDTPTLINETEIKATVTPKGSSNKLLSTTKKNMQVAPQGNFNFPVSLNNASLKPGSYTMHINANGDKGTQKWSGTKDFVVSKLQANKLNKSAVKTPTEKNQPNYKLIITLIVIAAIIIIGLLIWNFRLQRRNRR